MIRNMSLIGLIMNLDEAYAAPMELAVLVGMIYL